VRQGETIALVGPTGGGKSTIVNLLCRFYEPARRSASAARLPRLSLQAIQSRIGVVLQTPHLFSGTIRENIRYGRLDATDEEVEEAARLAGAHEFIRTLAAGLRRARSARGRQPAVGGPEAAGQPGAGHPGRARDLYHGRGHQFGRYPDRGPDPAGMENADADRTSFVIAHRLSTIKRADRILVIEDGRSPRWAATPSCSAPAGHYYRLYTRQFRQSWAIKAV
jgi:ATP-binding cassette, subfamily B, bacterial